jgi:hypothetical protein
LSRRDAGISAHDAGELAEIVASEKPSGPREPFGPATQDWLAKNLGKASSGAWSVGVGVATQVIATLVKQFYGLD